jgi:hypothetical protein
MMIFRLMTASFLSFHCDADDSPDSCLCDLPARRHTNSQNEGGGSFFFCFSVSFSLSECLCMDSGKEREGIEMAASVMQVGDHRKSPDFTF